MIYITFYANKLHNFLIFRALNNFFFSKTQKYLDRARHALWKKWKFPKFKNVIWAVSIDSRGV